MAIVRAWGEGPAPATCLDLGSGNGFPGVIVALAWPSARVVLLERRRKKARAIQACLEAAGLAGRAEALALDARELKRERPELVGACDLVTVRAVGPLDATTRLAAPLLAPGGRVVHFKPTAPSPEERRAGDAAARSLGLDVRATVRSVEGGRLVIYASGTRRS